MGKHFRREESGSYTRDLDIDATNGVKYDLLGEIRHHPELRRKDS